MADEPVDVLPTIKYTKKMTYINMVIKETLHMNGPAVHVLTRIAAEDTELSRTFVPEGTQLTINTFDIQHTEEFWKNSDVFDPERFDENGEAARKPEKIWLGSLLEMVQESVSV